MMRKYVLIGVLLALLGFGSAQSTLTGKVFQIGENGDTVAVSNAAVQWLHTSIGTHTDQYGKFTLNRTKTDTLVISFPTFLPDTMVIPRGQNGLTFFLNTAHNLNEVSIVARDGSYISVQPIYTQIIGTEGLRRAACCNLAESFESSVAIDSEFPDAVSGARQISMLGLAGTYSQILLENVPYIRLLSHQFGLGFIPGSWMESISLSKGTSSVVNGFEAITGQINVDYKKPESNLERFFMNFYANSMGKGELAMNTRIPVGKNEKASTNFLVFLADQFVKMDMNHDGFMDVPRSRQVNVMNRWDYKAPVVEGRTMIDFVWDNRFGGQMGFIPNGIMPAVLTYGFTADNKRVDVITKNGFLLKGEHESIGTILSYTGHWLDSHYGYARDYLGNQHSVYANILYSNKFGNASRHKLTAGASLQYDYLDETFKDGHDFYFHHLEDGQEIVPGVFAEYAYILDPTLVLTAGMRLDYNMKRNKYTLLSSMEKQLYWTPRLHAKWQINKDLSLRASIGKGHRNAHFFAENQSLLFSSRAIRTDELEKAQEAWNIGARAVWQFNMPGGKATLAVDYFYTHFVQQMIVDLDQDVHAVHYYALNGFVNGHGNRSRSHSAQFELTLKPLQRFEILLAYRYNDVRYMRNGVMRQKDMMSPHKALVNLNYSTPYDKWKFNINCQIYGPMPLPNTQSNPEPYRRPDVSKPYCLLAAQITKKFRKWEIYAGAENLLNVKQKDPIVQAENPFGEYFDATMVYKPITGIMGYVGVRVILK
ncbi:MAG: TonB-dependent receptor [Bacteroidales bacterium]|nr:TonB-dependent receptor [Bacteroidales bacterium]